MLDPMMLPPSHPPLILTHYIFFCGVFCGGCFGANRFVRFKSWSPTPFPPTSPVSFAKMVKRRLLNTLQVPPVLSSTTSCGAWAETQSATRTRRSSTPTAGSRSPSPRPTSSRSSRPVTTPKRTHSSGRRGDGEMGRGRETGIGSNSSVHGPPNLHGPRTCRVVLRLYVQLQQSLWGGGFGGNARRCRC